MRPCLGLICCAIALLLSGTYLFAIAMTPKGVQPLQVRTLWDASCVYGYPVLVIAAMAGAIWAFRRARP